MLNCYVTHICSLINRNTEVNHAIFNACILLKASVYVLFIRDFLKIHDALDVNNRSNFDILHRHTVDSNGKHSLQVVRNSNFCLPQNHITRRTMIES